MREKLLSYLSSLQENNLAFFAFRKSGDDEVIIRHQKDDYVHKTVADKLSYVIFDKYQNTKNQLIINSEVIKKFTLVSFDSVKPSVPVQLPEYGKDVHVAMVEKAIIALQTTTLEKVVLSRKQDIEITQDFESIYLNALDSYKKANVYFFHHPQIGTWIGATPETLLTVHNNHISTMSLAGTAIYKDGVTHEWGKKELEEQQIVTDYIKKQLNESGCDDIVASPVATAQAGNLIHLKSSITAQLSKNTTVSQVLHNLHPTPAVCGLPIDLAKDFIQNHENYDREFYTGYFGIVDHEAKQEDYYVNLRCMQLTRNMATLYVGGGITSSSDATDEYQETVEKLKTMGSILL